jgi:hypothetical protein
MFINMHININIKGEPRSVGESKSQRKKRNNARNKLAQALLLGHELPIRDKVMPSSDLVQEDKEWYTYCLEQEEASTIHEDVGFLRFGDQMEEKYEGNGYIKRTEEEDDSVFETFRQSLINKDGETTGEYQPLWGQDYLSSPALPPILPPPLTPYTHSLDLIPPPPFGCSTFPEPPIPLPPSPYPPNPPPPTSRFPQPLLTTDPSPVITQSLLPSDPSPPGLGLGLPPSSKSPQSLVPTDPSPVITQSFLPSDPSPPGLGLGLPSASRFPQSLVPTDPSPVITQSLLPSDPLPPELGLGLPPSSKSPQSLVPSDPSPPVVTQSLLPSNSSPPVVTEDLIYDWELPDTEPSLNIFRVLGELSDNWDDDL